MVNGCTHWSARFLFLFFNMGGASQRVLPQQMTSDFCQEPENLENLLLIENISAFAFYLKTMGYYHIYERKDFERIVYLYLTNHYRQPVTANLVKDIIAQLKWNLKNRVDDVVSSNYIALSDKLLNLETFLFEDFSNKKPVFYKVDCSSENIIKAEAPRFKQFLNEVLVNHKGEFDKDLESLVQEIFGYCFLNTLEGHATFFLVGNGNNGKSVLLSVLRNMIGLKFSESMSIETITTNRFAPAGLIGKKINICVEEESEFVKSDKFKALVSGDSEISVEFKYGDRFQWKPTVKYVFATNKLPTFNGFNEGLLRRIKIIPFNKRIETEKRDTKLIGKLLAEMGGIVAWTVEGAKRLIKNGFNFTDSLQVRESQKEFTSNLSSSVLFFWENFEEDESGQVFYDELYEEYKLWATRRGKKQQSYYSFFGDIDKILKLKPSFGLNHEGQGENCKKIKHKTTKPEYDTLPDFK